MKLNAWMVFKAIIILELFLIVAAIRGNSEEPLQITRPLADPCEASPAVAESTEEITNTALGCVARHAVLKIYTHGASATVVATRPGKTYLVGCGHAETARDRVKKHGFEIPVPVELPKEPIKSRVLASQFDERGEYQVDLSLVELDYGPLPYVAPVAPKGWKPSNNLISVGYDDMKVPATQRPCHIIKAERDHYKTKERPWHGRSGGGLIDEDGGYLIGVCSGYSGPKDRREVSPGNHGIYVSHECIVKFLESKGYGWLVTTATYPQPYSESVPQALLPAPVPLALPKPYYEVKKEYRIPNKTGSQCVWSALSTMGKCYGLPLDDLCDKYKGTTGPAQVASVLKARGIHFWQQQQGDKDRTVLRAAGKNKAPFAIGLSHTHMVLGVGYSEEDQKVWWIDNLGSMETQEVPMQVFNKHWDGWLVLMSNNPFFYEPKAAPVARPAPGPSIGNNCPT